MGCNCGKNKRSVAEIQAAQAKSPQLNQANTQGQTTTPPKPKPTGQTQTFTLKMRDGKSFSFGSRLEADAENVRRGYSGTVRPT